MADEQQKEEEGELILFGSWFCPYVQRVWFALGLMGLKYRYVEIDPYANSDGCCFIIIFSIIVSYFYQNG